MLKIDTIAPNLVIHSTPDRIVVPARIQAHVDAIWSAEQVRRSRPMHDGELFSLTTRTATRWTGALVPYRRFVAQLRCPDLFEHLQVRPVAVSGVLIGPDGVVFGRRAEGSTQFAGWWELAPSGGLDGACLRADGTIDYVGKIVEELVEETGCLATHVTRLRPFVVVEDPSARTTDIGVELLTTLDRSELERRVQEDATGEYRTVKVIHRDVVADFVGRRGDEIVAVSIVLLEQLGWLASRSANSSKE